VTLSFDVDAESGNLGMGEVWARRLTSLSQGRYGIRRGLPRILDLLDIHGIRATFFVPGYTAEIHAEAIREIARSGHEIGHHGYLHERPDTLGPEQERAVLEKGLEAIERVVGIRTIGYRSPSWEITPTTLELLQTFGFLYDSSGMGDDQPYIEQSGDYRMLELPVQWILDDWPHFGYENGYHGQIADPAKVFAIWSAEFDGLYEEGGHFVLTMHPEVIGRPHRMAMLAQLIDYINRRPNVWWAAAEDVAAHCAPLLLG
jgi:peptidoglycan/xylan/chitin deacetylase (PgdA/CDA1 family)